VSLNVACVLVPDLPIQLEQQRRNISLPILIPHPLDGSTIFAASPEAVDAGVEIGMSLYQAQQMAPAALVVEPDETAYHACHGTVFAALQAYSPLIETVAMGEFLVDVRAVVRDADGDAGLARALVNAVTRTGSAVRLGQAQSTPRSSGGVRADVAAGGVAVRVGMANGKFTAQQAARQAPTNGAIVVPDGGEVGFLAPLPLSGLPGLTGEMRRRLALFDLYTLGDLSALPKAAALRQFGGDISSAFELARGRDPRPLNPDVPPLRIVRSLRLSTPLSNRQALLSATNRLAWQISKALAAKGYHAEGLKLTLYAADGSALEAGQAAKPPTSDDARLGRLAALLLGRLTVEAPVAAVALSVYPLRSWHLSAHQITLADAGVPEKLARFEAAVQLLIHRFGETVLRVAALLGPPVPIKVRVGLNAHGLPAQIDYAGLSRVVIVIDEHWREERLWWSQPVHRDYFRVRLSDDSPRDIFQDLTDGGWYLDRARRIL